MTSYQKPCQNLLLRQLPDAEYQRLSDQMELIELSLGQVIYEPGDLPTYAYFPIDSIISMIYVMENSASTEVAVIGNDGMAGIALFMGGGSMSNRVEVIVAGSCYRLKSRLLIQEFQNSKSIMIILLRYLQSLMTQTAQTAACNRHHCLEQQLCRWILLSLDRLQTNELRMTHELIANMLGVRREGVTEAARKLANAGLISYHRGRIVLLDRAGLEARVCECYQAVKAEHTRLFPRVCNAKNSMRRECRACRERSDFMEVLRIA